MKQPHPSSLSDIFLAEAEQAELETRAGEENRLAELLQETGAGNSSEQARLGAATLLRQLGRHDEAIALLAAGTRSGASARLWTRYIDILAECNRTEQAIGCAGQARIAFPDDVLFQMKEALLLPVIYDSLQELNEYRARFEAGLDRLGTEIRLDDAEQRVAALDALQNLSIIMLGYQGRDDRNLQVRYGNLVHRIVTACYPEWNKRLRMPPVSGREPLRIGYVGERFRDLSGMRHFLGWMRGHNRDRFAVYAWYTGATMDKVTEEIRSMSAGFHHFPRTQPQAFEETCRSIRSLNLHALIFLDAGMESDITQIAALRLAPLQCKAWDQPITSGLPTIDYAFTPELSEPEGGERHYSEQLMRLPGVGVCYQKPIIPTPLLRKTRRDFGLREDACVYLCSQQAFKFLPQNDAVFAQIASRVPDAQFVFTIMNAPVRSDFLRRLSRAFEAVGLRAEDHCVVLPELRHLDYWNLQLLGDVFLDTIGWSSGGSVFEAIACNVPVVTVAGEFMRGRQGAGILLQLGLGDTVARDIAEYVELAARLGQNRPFREEIVRRVAAGHPGLFSDARSVGALDDFFEREIFPRAGR